MAWGQNYQHSSGLSWHMDRVKGRRSSRNIHNTCTPTRAASNILGPSFLCKIMAWWAGWGEISHEQATLYAPFYDLEWGPTREKASWASRHLLFWHNYSQGSPAIPAHLDWGCCTLPLPQADGSRSGYTTPPTARLDPSARSALHHPPRSGTIHPAHRAKRLGTIDLGLWFHWV